MNTDIASIVDKVQKLLRLASNNPNEAEAASAATKAQDLLTAYNLDMTTVEQGSSAGKREDQRMAGGLYRWQRALWSAVAKLNFCMYWSEKGTAKGSIYQHKMVGRSVNILSTKLMAEYLEQAIERITRDRYDNDPKLYFSKAGVAFREGMADRIVGRVNDRRYQAETEARRQKAEQQAKTPNGSANALTILDVIQSERDANYDFLYGEGYSARARADIACWSAESEARQRAATEAAEKFEREHPTEFAALQAEKAKQDARNRKREAYNDSRRKGRFSYGSKLRHGDYHTGFDRGGDVSLDQQVARRDVRKLT